MLEDDEPHAVPVNGASPHAYRSALLRDHYDPRASALLVSQHHDSINASQKHAASHGVTKGLVNQFGGHKA